MLNFRRIFGNVWKVEEEALSKGAVRNVSAVHGKSKAMQKLFNVGEVIFLPADSVWFCIQNPMVPTVHANWRISKCMMRRNIIQQWFGGGQDLTLIIYLKKMHFHQTCKIACDKHNPILSKI
jgi:coproporphyrinogen III oxidase